MKVSTYCTVVELRKNNIDRDFTLLESRTCLNEINALAVSITLVPMKQPKRYCYHLWDARVLRVGNDGDG